MQALCGTPAPLAPGFAGRTKLLFQRGRFAKSVTQWRICYQSWTASTTSSHLPLLPTFDLLVHTVPSLYLLTMALLRTQVGQIR